MRGSVGGDEEAGVGLAAEAERDLGERVKRLTGRASGPLVEGSKDSPTLRPAAAASDPTAALRCSWQPRTR